MKFAVIRKKRAVSAFLSVCMTATMLPLAPIASAIDETAQPPDVRIGWAAAGAAENGVGTIRLTAELGQESVVQSAEVRIRLTAEEAMLLDWECDLIRIICVIFHRKAQYIVLFKCFLAFLFFSRYAFFYR